MKQRRYLKIYKKWYHAFITLLITSLPFLFIWFIEPNANFDRMGFLTDLAWSTVRLIIAFAISLFLALVLGITLTRGKLGDFFLPLFDVLQSFPSFAILPLAVNYFGSSNITVISFLVITMVWPMLFAVASSVKLVKAEWQEAAQIYGATGIKRFLYFGLPTSYPGLITGAIVGLGEGWEAVVGAEIISGYKDAGLGNFFAANGETGSVALFGIFALLLMIFVMNRILFLPLLEKSHKLLSE